MFGSSFGGATPAITNSIFGSRNPSGGGLFGAPAPKINSSTNVLESKDDGSFKSAKDGDCLDQKSKFDDKPKSLLSENTNQYQFMDKV